MPRTNLVRVPDHRLRQMFNDGQYYERLQAGELLGFDGGTIYTLELPTSR